jgi:chromosome segregation ATPase
MNINITHSIKFEDGDGYENLLKLILRRLDYMNQDITQLQTDLADINAKVTEQGVVLNKVAGESIATLAQIEKLETQISELEAELAGNDLSLPQEIKDTVAAIKASIEANKITLSSVDNLVPDLSA